MTKGLATLINGDCIPALEGFANGSVDLVITDIPYGEVNRKSNGLRNLDKSKADIVTFDIPHLIDELCRVACGSIYVFCGTEQVSGIRKGMVSNGLSTRLLIWEKTNPSPMNGDYIWLSGVECCVYWKHKGATFNGHCKNGVFRYPCGKNKLHPTQKPLKLIEEMLLASSHSGDTVLDPFMGSGTTGVAALKNGRNFIGIELDKEYFEIAKERICD